jgi:hypothetical protein
MTKRKPLVKSKYLEKQSRWPPIPPSLTVKQAQAVKGALIDGLMSSKSQAPITFQGHQYDASDRETSAMSKAISGAAQQNIDAANTALSTTTSNVVSAINSTVSNVNSAFTSYKNNVNAGVSTLGSTANTVVQGLVESPGCQRHTSSQTTSMGADQSAGRRVAKNENRARTGGRTGFSGTPTGAWVRVRDSMGETPWRSKYSSRNVRRLLGITPCDDADCPRSLANLAAR